MGIETAGVIAGTLALAAGTTAVAANQMGKGASAPIVPPIPDASVEVEDEEELRRIARQRKDLEAQRAGRKSLKIDLTNPGIASTSQVINGLRIPD